MIIQLIGTERQKTAIEGQKKMINKRLKTPKNGNMNGNERQKRQ